MRIAQNKINSDMYITDRNLGKDLERDDNFSFSDLSSTGKVLALDKDYKVRYQYTGTGQYRNRKSFSPYGLCTDNTGHVLISDHNNHRVHILDKDGQFLGDVLNWGQKEPYNIDVDNEGNLWVGSRDGGVFVVKYLQ